MGLDVGIGIFRSFVPIDMRERGEGVIGLFVPHEPGGRRSLRAMWIE